MNSLFYFVMIIATVGVTIFLVIHEVMDKPPEISNNITLIAEVCVGIIVTLVVLMISNKNEKSMQEKINRVTKLINLERIKELKKSRTGFLGFGGCFDMINFDTEYMIKNINNAKTNNLHVEDIYEKQEHHWKVINDNIKTAHEGYWKYHTEFEEEERSLYVEINNLIVGQNPISLNESNLKLIEEINNKSKKMADLITIKIIKYENELYELDSSTNFDEKVEWISSPN